MIVDRTGPVPAIRPLTEDEENALLEPLPRKRETTLYNLFDEGRSISITTDDERLQFAIMKSDRKWPYANERFARDDLRDLWAEVKASPGTHLIAAVLGLAVGCFGTVGIAYLIAGVVA